MASFNFFSDPALRTRQDQLNAQWYALFQQADQCQLDPVSQSALSQFFADYQSWKDFYDSGSDWTQASKTATDEWQTKLKEYTVTIGQQTCGTTATGQAPYVPGVKDPPPDAPSLTQQLTDSLRAPFDYVQSLFLKVGIGLLVAIIIVIAILAYVATRTKFKGYGAELG